VVVISIDGATSPSRGVAGVGRGRGGSGEAVDAGEGDLLELPPHAEPLPEERRHRHGHGPNGPPFGIRWKAAEEEAEDEMEEVEGEGEIQTLFGPLHHEVEAGAGGESGGEVPEDDDPPVPGEEGYAVGAEELGEGEGEPEGTVEEEEGGGEGAIVEALEGHNLGEDVDAVELEDPEGDRLVH